MKPSKDALDALLVRHDQAPHSRSPHKHALGPKCQGFDDMLPTPNPAVDENLTAVANAGDTGRPIALGEGPAADAYRAIVDLLVTEAAPPIEMAGCTARLLAAAEEALDAADA